MLNQIYARRHTDSQSIQHELQNNDKQL